MNFKYFMMKKKLLLIFGFITTFGFSQQSAEYHQANAGTQDDVVAQYQIRNGSDISNVIGNYNFGASSGVWGGEGFYTPSNNKYYDPNNAPVTFTTANSIQIGNATAIPTNTLQRIYTVFTAEDGSGVIFDCKPITSLHIDRDTNNDGFYDIMEVKSNLPKVKSNLIDLLPANTWYIKYSINGEDSATTLTTNTAKVIALKFTDLGNGNYQWMQQTIYPDGTPIQPVQILSTTDVKEYIKSKLKYHPNPTNNFITIQNKENSIENFEYKIVDVAGRIIKNGKSKFNEQMSVEELPSGVYLVKIQTDKNSQTLKIIKK